MEAQYYRERLGFAPPLGNGHQANGHSGQQPAPVSQPHSFKSNVGYEESLHKFKGNKPDRERCLHCVPSRLLYSRGACSVLRVLSPVG